MKKRFLALALVMCMLLSVLPVNVSAASRWDVINKNGISGQDIVNKAKEYIGVPYDTSGGDYRTRTGFTTPQYFDCSGLVYRVCREVGLASSRQNYTMGVNDNNGNALEGRDANGNYYITAHTHEQKYYGTDLSSAVNAYLSRGDTSGFAPGDLLFFDYGSDNVTDHVGIYSANGKVINATTSRGVIETPLSQTGWPEGTLGNSLYAACRLVDSSNTASCSHSYSSKVTTAATCTTNGVRTYTCSKCGASYTETIAATGNHSYTSKVTTAATCTTSGVRTYTCSVCGGNYAESIAATGHSYGSWVTTKAAGCNTTGERYRTCSACGDMQIQTINAVGHNYVSTHINATCMEYGYTEYVCWQCEDYYKVYDIDTYSEWSTTKPTGVDESLIESRTEYRYQTKEFTTSDSSSLSGWTLYGTTSQWSNYGPWSSWSDTPVTASDTTKVETQTVYGYYYYLCPKCGAHMHGYGTCWTWAGGCGATTTRSGWHEIWSTTSWDNAGLRDWYGTGKYYAYIDGELAFKWSESSPKTQYRYCTREQEYTYRYYKWSDWSDWSTTVVTESDTRNVETRTVYRSEKLALGDHRYKSTVTAPTCSEQGYTTYTCSVCGDSYKSNYTNVSDHSYRFAVTKKPTTSATGTLTGTCSMCSGTTKLTLPKLNTADYTYKVVTAATCAEAGTGRYTWKTTTYGTYYFDVTIPSTGHDYVSKVTAPTCTAQGYTTYTCSSCGNSYRDSYTNAKGHIYTDNKDATCNVCGYVRVVESTTTVETVPMYRLYNPWTGEHFYTGSSAERDNLVSVGWNYEGVAWNAPVVGEPVYRVYNPWSGDHHYTMSWDEVQFLINAGWKYENVAWNTASSDNIPLYRLRNPWADLGSHHYTSSTTERDMLVNAGWILEGIGWYGMLK